MVLPCDLKASPPPELSQALRYPLSALPAAARSPQIPARARTHRTRGSFSGTAGSSRHWHGQQQHTVLSQSLSPMESELPRRRRETRRKPWGRAIAAGGRPRGRHPGAGTVLARASRAGPCASRRGGGRGRGRRRLRGPGSAGPCSFLHLGFVWGACFVGTFFFLLIPRALIGAHASPRRPLLPSKEEAGTPGRWQNPRAQTLTRAGEAAGKPWGHRARDGAESIHRFYWLRSRRK